MEKCIIELVGNVNGRIWMWRKAVDILREVKRRISFGESHNDFIMETEDGPVKITSTNIQVHVGKDSKDYPGLSDEEAQIYWLAWNDGCSAVALKMEDDLESIDNCVTNGGAPFPFVENVLTRCWDKVDCLEITRDTIEEVLDIGAGL